MKIVLFGAPSIALHSELVQALPSEHRITLAEYDASSAELTDAFENATAVITVRYDGSIPLPDSLKLVQVPGVGYDEIDLSLIQAQTSVCNVSGHGPAVAEYVLLGLLQCRHRFMEAVDSFRRGSWERSSRLGAAPHGELAGSVVGLLGYGLIGRSIAQRLSAMDVTVNVCNRTLPDSNSEHSEINRFYPLSDLAAMANDVDYLVCVIALNEQTQGMVDTNVLEAMKSDAILINVARGPVVEEQALYQSLAGEHIGGAVLDVWYNYPTNAQDADVKPSTFDFAGLPNTYITPHISGWTSGTVRRRIAAIAENIEKLDRGDRLNSIVLDCKT
jgi:phosphoglycerate dehydrogenase-like enzyme